MANGNRSNDTEEERGRSGGVVPGYRRRFLKGLGATGFGAIVAGCLGDDGDDPNGNGDDPNGDDPNGDDPNGDENEDENEDEDEWIQLFNGEDLEDWTPKFTGHEPGVNYNDTFVVEDGVLRVDYSNYDSFDDVFGHLFYDDEFSHYILRVEYRFVGEQAPDGEGWAFRNNGLMLHGQQPEGMDIDQDFPRSLEFQLLGEEEGTEDGRSNGDLCTPGTHAHNMDGELVTAHCWTETEGSVYEGDDWVTATAVVRGNERIRHILEDDGVVLEYQQPVVAPDEPEADADEQVPIDSGTISIQSESHPTEFRTIELKPIDPDSPIGEGDPTSPNWDNYRKKELAAGLDEPMAIEVAPDGRILFTERGEPVDGGGNTATGRVGVLDPESGEIATALELDVYTSGEDGLQGLTLDPDFEDNGWVYLYYSAPHEIIDEDSHKRLSRFTVEGDTIDPDSEVEILRVPAADDPDYHVGGDLEFGPEGNLWISVGDDVSPHDSSGYTPIDERGELFDAQGTAANSNDLRGSILRITPTEDGSYDVPDGNMFTGEEYEGEPVREEIYAMGCRNPFRMAVDEDGAVYWGDYGPDARQWDAERGPPGIVEFNRAEEPGYYGWPYVIGPNLPYVDYDFGTGESGEPFDPENLVNDSPNNDGLTELPTPEEATIWYPYSWDVLLDSAPDYAAAYLSDEPSFPEFEGGAPMSGPVFHHEDDFGPRALPEQFFDGTQLIGEWNEQWLRYVSYDADGTVEDVEPFMPDESFLSPMDMTIGPDGTLYLLEWGDGYASPISSLSGIYRIERLVVRPSIGLESDSLAPGGSTTATVSVENVSEESISDGQLSLAADSDEIEATSSSEASFDSLAAGESRSVEYEIDVGADVDQGTYTLTADVTYTVDGETESVEASAEIEIPHSEPLQHGLEAHFPLDGDTPTNEVTGTDATVHGDVATGQSGIVGDAYEFDVNQETGVEIPPDEADAGDGVVTDSLPLNGEGATAAAWLNYTDHEQWARAPFQVGGSIDDSPNGGWNIQFESNDDALRSELWADGNPSNGSGGTPIPVDPETWYFVAMVVEGGDARLHVFDEDGELDDSPQTWTSGSRTQSDAEPLCLGVGQGYDIAGRVDDVWAYSRALSESDVANLYELSLEGEGVSD